VKRDFFLLPPVMGEDARNGCEDDILRRTTRVLLPLPWSATAFTIRRHLARDAMSRLGQRRDGLDESTRRFPRYATSLNSSASYLIRSLT
jgi:hypothetical protein